LTQIQKVRVLKLSAAYFVISLLFGWRSAASWDWGHLKNWSGAGNVLFHLLSSAGSAFLFGVLFEAIYFGWFVPKFQKWRLQGEIRN
jgi:hypothetical protein